MNDFWKISLSFLAGALVGGLAVKKYIDYKNNEECEYEEIVGPEEGDTDNIEEDANKKQNVTGVINNVVPREKVNYNKIKTVEDEEYTRLLDELKYTSEQETREILGEMIYRDHEGAVDTSKPYNISQDEFEEVDGYESDEYTYYADGYLTDSYGMPVSKEDVINTIGEEFDTYFGTYDDDQIWVRNERLQMDFSVIRDVDRFVDVASPRIKRMVGL